MLFIAFKSDLRLQNGSQSETQMQKYSLICQFDSIA